ncbi:VWA domain-containing protein [Streptomyces albidoflavus]|uniref:VWA domain-containing protein n=1 Tax=Streptomyces albidoflavus TaxID=1886 RepID=UPI0033C46511
MAPPHRRRAAVAVRALVALTALLCTTGLAPAATSGPAARAAVAEVPPPTATTSVVTVRTGGDRTADAEVGPLAGVTLGLFADEGATEPVDPDWGVCVSDADGDCSFTVPGTGPGGPNEGAVYTVRQIAAPSGWYTNPELRTGPGSGSGSLSPAYAFPTPELEGGQTYSSTSDFMYSTEYRESPFTASTGIWQQSRNNPPLNGACGIDVALVLDLSASVGSALPQLKDAADQFTDALAGTPSRLSLFSFDRNSPSTGTENHPEPTSVSTQAGADAFKSLYADWDLGSGTNWDQGLYAVAKAPTRYDLTVVLTDGNPTRFSKPIEGDGSRTHFADTEGGIFAANAVKAEGTRVVAVGVGRGVEGVSGLNLRAISGPEAFTGDNPETADYYQTTDFTAAGAALNQLALSNCAGTVSVIKQIVPESNTGEDVSGSRNAGPGWEFTASSTEPLGGLPDTRATDDDGTGGVTFEPEFPPTTGEAPVTVEETQQPDHTLVTQGGANAVCVNLDDGASVPVTNSGPTGFTVDLARQGGVSCTVYNRPDPSQDELADLTVDKRWIIDGTTYDEGDQPGGNEATLTLTGPGGAGATPQPWGTTRAGYQLGDTATVDEEVTPGPGCRLVSREVTEINGDPATDELPYEVRLDREHTELTVTNTLTCRPDEVDLTVDKRWTIDGTTYDEGDQPGGNEATLTLTGPDGAGATPQPWGTPRTGYARGDEATVDEDVTVAPGCRFLGLEVTDEDDNPVTGELPFSARLDRDQNRFTVTNTVTCRPESVDLTVDKRWTIDGTPYAEGDQPDGYEATLTLTGPDGAAATPQPWGTPRTGYAPGDTATVDEETTLPDRCELTDSQVTEANGDPATGDLPFRATLDREHTRLTVTNTVTCDEEEDSARLRLVKKVVNRHGGTATPSDWQLTATGPDQLGGPGGAVGEVAPGTYQLAESDGPEGYDASGWSCVGENGPIPVTDEDEVTLAAGQRATCTVTNTDREGPGPSPSPTPTPTPTHTHGPGPGGELPDTGGPGATELLALAVGLTAAGALAALVTGARRRFRDRNGPATG